MKQLNITILLTMLMSMTGFNASAHDIEVKNADGVTIYYNYINNNTELSVTYRGFSYSDYSNEYTGNVIIPVSVAYNGKTYSVTSIGIQAFYDCSGLTSVTIPESVKSLGHGVFMNCTGLTSITIPESVKSIGQSAFYGTAWYDNQPDGLVYAGKVAYKYKGTMPEKYSLVLNEGTTSISSYAFQNCSSLISVAIPNSVTNIGSYAFSACSSLTSIEIPNSVTETGDNAFTGTPWYENQPDGLVYAGKVAYKYKGTMPENTSIVLNDGTASVSPFAFYDCSSLISITIPESVTNIDNRAFQNCSGITSLIIPNSVTNIGKYAFSGCSGISSIIVSSGNKKYDSRENCNAIIETASKTLVVGCKNTIIPHSVTSIGEYAFENCSGLTSITIPNSVTNIGQDAFIGTAWYENQPDGLVYAGKVAYMYKGTMPENTSIVLNDGTVSISALAFANRTGLTSITIPESVTSISSYAFQNCSSLISVAIPNSVTTIGRMAFSWCSTTVFRDL